MKTEITLNTELKKQLRAEAKFCVLLARKFREVNCAEVSLAQYRAWEHFDRCSKRYFLLAHNLVDLLTEEG